MISLTGTLKSLNQDLLNSANFITWTRNLAHLSENVEVSSCSLNSDPELERLLPKDPFVPLETGVRFNDVEREGVAIMLSSSNDVVMETAGKGETPRVRLPLKMLLILKKCVLS